MFKGWLVFLSVLISTSAFATTSLSERCKTNLTDDYRKDSVSFQVNLDDHNPPNFRNDKIAKAIFAIRAVLRENNCARKAINFSKGMLGKSKHNCTYVHRKFRNSLVCYIQTNLGFFFVSEDYVGNTNVVYNRWD
jgi:hypothetical protein